MPSRSTCASLSSLAQLPDRHILLRSRHFVHRLLWINAVSVLSACVSLISLPNCIYYCLYSYIPEICFGKSQQSFANTCLQIITATHAALMSGLFSVNFLICVGRKGVWSGDFVVLPPNCIVFFKVTRCVTCRLWLVLPLLHRSLRPNSWMAAKWNVKECKESSDGWPLRPIRVDLTGISIDGKGRKVPFDHQKGYAATHETCRDKNC